MKHRPLIVMLIGFVLAVACPANALPRQLKNAGEILSALKAGGLVRVVLHYKDMSLVDEKGQPQASPDAVGGMDLGTYEYFATGAVGNQEGYVAVSHTQLIRHPRHGSVLNYVKISVYDGGTVKIVAQYLSPTTYEVKMDETFSTIVADGTNKGAAVFYLVE